MRRKKDEQQALVLVSAIVEQDGRRASVGEAGSAGAMQWSPAALATNAVSSPAASPETVAGRSRARLELLTVGPRFGATRPALSPITVGPAKDFFTHSGSSTEAEDGEASSVDPERLDFDEESIDAFHHGNPLCVSSSAVSSEVTSPAHRPSSSTSNSFTTSQAWQTCRDVTVGGGGARAVEPNSPASAFNGRGKQQRLRRSRSSSTGGKPQF
jgi:hypothetical protein